MTLWPKLKPKINLGLDSKFNSIHFVIKINKYLKFLGLKISDFFENLFWLWDWVWVSPKTQIRYMVFLAECLHMNHNSSRPNFKFVFYLILNSKAHLKLRQISLSKKKFNMDSKKGMEYLIDNNLVENTPEMVASFLYNSEGLNKTSICEYLGEKL